MLTWVKFLNLLDILTKNNNFKIHSLFITLLFSQEGDCDKILSEGPWLFDGRRIVIKKWFLDVALERDLQSMMLGSNSLIRWIF